ncbi:hypothetical protein PRIPAC_88184 [Pristionchus pacificus]|uniref:Uncharacterized protein n=1 Tax=Pristionchus pacificus TaxID=54126 RepID=A0A2A6B9B1_PRIPA|nr:hypothetical protein PRIPAC_88184 [Pristionchus pacificus]|eukprot:PDM62454.1 hypothetical protein PRIPAC_51896 [Pristionchus pacificus]
MHGKLESNICGEIETKEGFKMRLRIPNWPINKRYDVNLKNAGLNDFLRKKKRSQRAGMEYTKWRQTLFAWFVKSSLKSNLKSRQIVSRITTSTRKRRDANKNNTGFQIEFAEDDAKWNDKSLSPV